MSSNTSENQRLTRSMRKRPRTDSDGEEEETPPAQAQEYSRHPSLWFEDGNIIIAAHSVGFRVHKSVLAAKSLVMKDMFSLPQPADAEKIEKCDVVHLEDDPFDLAIFLNLFYNLSNHLSQDRLPNWGEVKAMLVLGRKYQVNEMQLEAARRIRSVLPRSVQEVEKEKAGSRRLMDQDWTWSIIDMTNTTLSHALYNTHLRCLYECCQLSAEQLVYGVQADDGSVTSLHPDDLASCIDGRLRLIEMQCCIINDIVAAGTDSRCTTSSHYRKSINKLCRSWRPGSTRVLPMSNPLGFGTRTLRNSFEEEKICQNCKEASTSILKAGHDRVFNSMHTIFGREEPQVDVASYGT